MPKPNPATHPTADIAFIRDPTRPILTHGRALAAGQAIAAHSHPRGQRLWVMRGVLRVVCCTCVWVVPTSHAVWIPGDLCRIRFFSTSTRKCSTCTSITALPCARGVGRNARHWC